MNEANDSSTAATPSATARIAAIRVGTSALVAVRFEELAEAREKARLEAVQAGAKAREEGERALALAEENRLKVYAARIRLAYQGWDEGNAGAARELLDSLRPQPGEPDLPNARGVGVRDRFESVRRARNHGQLRPLVKQRLQRVFHRAVVVDDQDAQRALCRRVGLLRLRRSDRRQQASSLSPRSRRCGAPCQDWARSPWRHSRASPAAAPSA